MPNEDSVKYYYVASLLVCINVLISTVLFSLANMSELSHWSLAPAVVANLMTYLVLVYAYRS